MIFKKKIADSSGTDRSLFKYKEGVIYPVELNICPFLNLREKNNLISVSKHLRELIREHFQQPIDISNENIINIDQLLSNMHKAYSINLNGRLDFTNEALRSLVEACKVEELYLKGCTQITNTSLEYLTNINLLDLSDIPNLTLESVQTLNATFINLQGSPHLKEFWDQKLQDLSPNDFSKYLELQFLQLDQITQIALRRDTLMGVAQRYFKGKHIAIDRNITHHVTDDTLRLFRDAYSLHLRDNDFVTNDGLSCLNKLKEVALIRCFNITGKGLRHLENIQKLDLRDIFDINKGDINTSQLSFLNLRRCEFTESFLSECKSIQTMGFRDSRHSIRDEHLKNLEACENLDLTFNPEITNAALENMPNLKWLSSIGTQITGIGLKKLTKLELFSTLKKDDVFQAIDDLPTSIKAINIHAPESLDEDERSKIIQRLPGVTIYDNTSPGDEIPRTVYKSCDIEKCQHLKQRD